MSSDRKVALITGITGQDGSYLAEFLLEKGYTVSWLIIIVALRLVMTCGADFIVGIHRESLFSGPWNCPSFIMLQYWPY